MSFSKRAILAGALLVVSLGFGVLLNTGVSLSFAQDSASQSGAAEQGSQADPYQRSTLVYNMQRFGKTGWQRGEEIYYVRCWICHNDYTIKAEPGGAPTLRGVFKRSQLWNGQPVNDQTVSKQIREGSPRMPGFGHTLDDKMVSDVVAYLHDKCCWNEYDPPANPWYRY